MPEGTGCTELMMLHMFFCDGHPPFLWHWLYKDRGAPFIYLLERPYLEARCLPEYESHEL